MPDELRRLLTLLLEDISEQSAALAAGRITVDAWQQQMSMTLLTGHYAAMMEGRGQDQLSPQAQALVNRLVGEQLDYINAFADEMDATGWQDKYGARALLYGGALKATYYKGATYGYEMPHVPGDGSTPCLVNCQCYLEIDEINAEEIDVDVYWRLGAAEHCGPCVQRSQDWAPLRFRGGEQI